jgi:hypothetical protein
VDAILAGAAGQHADESESEDFSEHWREN